MRRDFEIPFAYALALLYGLLVTDGTASLALFNMISVAVPVWTFITNAGSMAVWLAVAACIFFWGQFSKVGRKLSARKAGAVLFLGIWFNAAIAFALKNIIARPRPPYEILTFELFEPVHEYGLSMPSGHAQMAFMAAAIIGYFYPKTRIPLLIFAGLVALSRIGLGAHWIMDVLVGAANGLLIAAVWIALPWDRMRSMIQKMF